MIAARTCPSCGYTASYTSQRQADAHHPRHSCAKHQQRAQVAGQRALRAQQGPTRPCQHPRAQHIHGTRAAYVKDRCRCAPCTAANAAAWAATHRAQAFGQWEPFVEAAAVRDHIGQLREAGIGVDQIAKLAGTSTSHIRELAEPGQPDKPPVHKVRPDTAKRILSVQATAANRAARSHLDARGTRRRVQALIATGWTHQQLAAQLGRTATNLKRSLASEQVTAHTAGEGAMDNLLDAYEFVDRLTPIKEMRYCITHANFPSQNNLERCKKLGVCADVQPAWLWKDGHTLLNVLGPKRMRWFQPYKSWLEYTTVGGGSDHMLRIDPLDSTNPWDPWLAIWVTLTRKLERGGVLEPNEALTREQALRLYTINNAYLHREEKEKGSLEVGKLADFIVIDRDYLNCPMDEIRTMKVLTTFVNGNVVWEKK